MNNYYSEEKMIAYRQVDLLAEAEREALIQRLKEANQIRAIEKGKQEKRPKFNWFFFIKSSSAA